MVCLVLPFITKGLTIILEYALALTLRLLFLLLILLPVTRLTSITILMMYLLFAFEIIHVEACISGPLLALSLCQVNYFGYIAILILTTRYCRFLRILYIIFRGALPYYLPAAHPHKVYYTAHVSFIYIFK